MLIPYVITNTIFINQEIDLYKYKLLQRPAYTILH
jgi:hypothetical protein